jgi:hypothetical protein
MEKLVVFLATPIDSANGVGAAVGGLMFLEA